MALQVHLIVDALHSVQGHWGQLLQPEPRCQLSQQQLQNYLAESRHLLLLQLHCLQNHFEQECLHKRSFHVVRQLPQLYLHEHALVSVVLVCEHEKDLACVDVVEAGDQVADLVEHEG